jgi:hypothetical protein
MFDIEVPLVPGPSDSIVPMTLYSALGAQSHWVGNEVQDLSSLEMSGGIYIEGKALHTLNK